MPSSLGLGLLRKDGVFLDIDPTPGKFIRSFFDRRLKPIVCTPRPDILDRLALAAEERKYLLPVAKIVLLNQAIPLVAELESGRRLGGKGLVAME
jgi:hypothetical protein